MIGNDIPMIPCDPRNYGSPRSAWNIIYLVYHYTGNDGDTAKANALYYQQNVVKASAHYFVDDDRIVQSVPDLTAAWAVGGKRWADCAQTGGGTMYGVITNANSISIEMCDTQRNGVLMASEKTLANAIELGRMLMEKYHIPLKNVYRHFDVTGKYCPKYFMDNAKWQAFKDRLREPEKEDIGMTKQEFLDSLTDEEALEIVQRAERAAGKLPPSSYAKSACERGIESGLFKDGDGDGLIDAPRAFVKRQELAVVLDRKGLLAT